MTLHIEIAPETEAKLAAQAAAKGVPLPEYLRQLLEQQASPATPDTKSPAARAAFWRDSSRGLPVTPPLSDAAVSRDGIYGNDRV